MVIGLRRRPQCHYCGKSNSPVNTKNRFTCQHCLADNFLDENGEVADVPPEVASSTPKQYAVPLESSFDSTQSIFCSTCLKNQFMYTDAMSHFLPDPDDPEYDSFERHLPDFQRRMEKQFPQCCVRCEPKVKAQLQQVTYNARSDHLRRVLERSKAGRLSRPWGWRSLVVNGAGLGFFVGLAVQLLWHALGSQSIQARFDTSPAMCFSTWPVPTECSDMVERYVGSSLLLSIICIWWNPKWQHKLKGRLGRLVGLGTYYRAQAAIMVVRFATWIALRDVPALERHRTMLHSVSLVFIALVAGYSLRIIQVDTTPLVNWQQDPAPLLVNGQFEIPQTASPPSSQPERFPLENLGTSQSTLEPWRPPTPPNEDVMDWAPSPATFVPQPKKIVYKSSQPTPFQGTLPALPRQGVFASRVRDQPEPPVAIGIPPGFFDKKETKPMTRAETKEFAQPKFFPNDVRNDTGLESIFGKVFSLQDDALELRRQSTPSATVRPGIFDSPTSEKAIRQDLPVRKFCSALAIAMLGGSTIWMAVNTYLELLNLTHACVALGVAAAVPVVDVAMELMFKSQVDNFKVVLLSLECLSVIGLVFSCPASPSVLLPLWTKLVVGTLCLLLVQEVYYFCTDVSVPAPVATHRPVVQAPVQAPVQQFNTVLEPDFLPTTTSQSVPRMRRDSSESVSSVSSINTTSTASGWKTPTTNHRADYPSSSRSNRSTRSTGINLGSLGLDDYTVGSSIAGPRTRSTRSTARNAKAW